MRDKTVGYNGPPIGNHPLQVLPACCKWGGG